MFKDSQTYFSSKDGYRHVIIFPSPKENLYIVTFYSKPNFSFLLREVASVLDIPMPLTPEMLESIEEFIEHGSFNYQGVFIS